MLALHATVFGLTDCCLSSERALNRNWNKTAHTKHISTKHWSFKPLSDCYHKTCVVVEVLFYYRGRKTKRFIIRLLILIDVSLSPANISICVFWITAIANLMHFQCKTWLCWHNVSKDIEVFFILTCQIFWSNVCSQRSVRIALFTISSNIH